MLKKSKSGLTPLGRAADDNKKYKPRIRPFDRNFMFVRSAPKKLNQDIFLAAVTPSFRDVRNQTIYNTGMEEQENTKRFYRKIMQKNHLRNCTYTALISLFRHGKTRKYD